MANEKANLTLGAASNGGSSGSGSSGGGSTYGGGVSYTSRGGGGGPSGGLQLGAAFDFKNPSTMAGLTIKGDSGSGSSAKADFSGLGVRAQIGQDLISSGRKKMEQADRLQGLLDNATKNTGLMLGQWSDSREGAALTDRGLTGKTGSGKAGQSTGGQVSFEGEMNKDGSTSGKSNSKASSKAKAESIKPTAAALTPEQRTQRKTEVREQTAQLEQDYRELNDRILFGRIGRDYTEEDVERLNSLETQIQESRDELKELQRDVNYGSVLGLNTMTGLEKAGLGVTKALDWALGEESIPWGLAKETGTLFGLDLEGKNPVTRLKEQGQREVEGWQDRAISSATGNDAAEVIGRHTQSISQSLPFVVINLMSMGTAGLPSAAGQTAELASTAAINQSSGLARVGTIAADGIKALARNPSAEYSFISSFGESYEDALEDGASEIEAMTYATLNSAYNAMIEVGGGDDDLGGMQMLPKVVRDALGRGGSAGTKIGIDYAKSIVQEIGEEEMQGIMERGLKSIYKNVPMYSATDENAVINPQVILDTARDTAIDTAIMGGGQTAINYAAQAAAQRAAARQAADAYQKEQSALQLGAQERAAAEARQRQADAYQDEQDAQLQASQAAERAAQLQQQAEEAQRQADAYQEEQSTLLQAAQEREAAADEAERVAAAARAAGDYQTEQTALLEATQARQQAEQLQQQAEEAQRQADAYQEEQAVILEAAQARQQEAAARQQVAAYQEEQSALQLGQARAQEEGLALPAAPGQETTGPLVNREATTPNTTIDRTTANRTGGNDNVQEDEQVTAQAQPGLLEQKEAQQGTGETGIRVGAADELRADPAAGTASSAGTEGQAVSDGSGQRYAAGRSGGEAGRLGRDAGTGRRNEGAGRSGRTSTGESIGDALRRSGQRQISSRAFGLERGTDTETFYEVPEELLTADLRQLRYGIGNRTGYSVEFISGPMQVMGADGQIHNINGFCDSVNRRIAVRVDSERYSAEQIARHEEFHAMADQDPQLVNEIRSRITKRFGRQEMEQIIRGYQIARRGVNRITDGADMEIREAQALLEEIFADANGNMNAFGFGANRFAYDTWTTITDRQRSQTANGTRETRGPPQQRYTYAGEQAETADIEQLNRAKEMERQDVDNETIRQQTGWFRGMDGKWRYEIDDSEAKFSRAGDLQFRKDHPEYDEYRNLMGRFGELTDEELNRFRSLDRMWSGEVSRLSRLMTESENPLTHVLDHDEIFAAYPELKKVRVRLRDLGEGTNGTYDPVNRVITINKDSNDKVNVLLHEIQHAIQNIEGFTTGASPEYWAANNNRENQELEERIEEIRESAREIRAELDRQQKNAGYDEFMEELYQKAEAGELNWNEIETRIQNFEREHAGIRSLNNALDQMKQEMQELRKRMRTAGDLYYNTAGEIEARDVQSRQGLSKEGRNRKAPDLGDEKTVFAEGSGVSYSTEGIREEFGIRGLNDYIGVQKAVIKTLDNEGFFDGKQNVVTMDSGEMTVEINKRGIRETLGAGDRFQTLPRELKELKLATIRQLPELIRKANLLQEGVENYHSESSKVDYAYLKSKAEIDGKPYQVTITVRQSVQKNLFWIHEIRTDEVQRRDIPARNNSEVGYNDALHSDTEHNVPQSAEESKQKFSVEDEDQVTFDEITGGEMERSSWDPVFRERYERAQQVEEDVQEYFRKMDENDPDWLSEEDIETMLDYAPYTIGDERAAMEDAGYVADILIQRAMDQTGEERQESYQLIERLLPYMSAAERTMFTGDGNSDNVTSAAFKRWYDRRHPSLYYPGYEPGDLFDQGKADSWTAWDNQEKETKYLRELLDSGKLMEPELSEARNMLDRLENPERRETFYSMDEDELREEYEQLGEEQEELSEFFENLDYVDGKYIQTDSGRTVTEQEVQDKATRLEEVENRRRELREVLPEESEEEAEETEEEPPFDMEDDIYEERRVAGELSLGETEREARETRPAEQTEAEEEQGLRLGAQEETEDREEAEGQMELPEDPKDRTIRELEAANRDLQKYAENWRKQASITGEGEETARRSDVRRFTNELADEAEYQGEKAELQQKVQRLADMVVSNNSAEGLDWNEIRSQAREIAEDLVDNSYTVVDPEADTRRAILSDLKRLKIRPDREWTSDFGDWNSVRQRLVGKMIFNAKEGRSIDDVYQELRGSYGEGLFPENITAGSDQLNRIIDALDQLRPSMSYNFASDQDAEMATQYYQNKITDEVLFGNIGPELTKADRNYRRVKERMRDAEQKLREVKKESRQKIEDLQKMQRYEVRAAMENQRKQARDREEKQKLRKRISQTGKRLIKYLTENNGQKNPIPEPLKEAVGKVLLDLDISGGMDVKQRKKYVQDMQQVARIVTQQNAYMEGNTDKWAGMYLDLPADIQAELDEHLQNVQAAMDAAEAKGKVWNPNMMGTEELQRLDEILTVLTSAITNSNEILSDARGAKISEEAAEGIREIDSLGTDRNRSGRGESLNKFLRFQNTTPYYFFKRMGKAGMRMFERIQDGWDKFAFNARQVVDFANETYTEQEAKEIQETVYEFQLRRRGDMSEGFEKPETVRMTKAQIMSLYCLWKREQAQGHLMGAGIRIADFKDGKSSVTQAENYLLDLEDIAKITSKLTDRDREIADALQKYMNTVGSDWGNEVSMKRFGIRSFTEENYFPISTDDRTRPVRNPESDTANLYRLLNMSFTKATQRGASNSVVLDNIFDVFANHMADMAKYNGLGLPMLDAMKWVSYNQTSELNESGQYGYESVQKSMERAFGKEARTYFTTFMKDLNGVREGGRGEEFGSRMLSSYKVAAVGANIRVALLQPTSYVRASAVLGKKYLVKGLSMSNKQGQEEATKWSGTAVWKDLGFYDTNINAGLREMIKHTDGLKGKVQEASMKGAELGDKMTWGALWNACKAEQTDQGFTGDELMQKTAERFREVVYRTQVMDSTMTRSHVMRQKGAYAGMVTAFMSEPTLSYNMLLDAYTEYENEVRKEAKGSTDKATLKQARAKAWEKAGPAVGKATTAYLATAALSAIVESVIDAARDDDEYANFLERFAEKLLGFNVKDPDSTTWEKIKGITSGNLMQDLLVHNKLPVVKDFFSILSGNSTSRMDTEWMNNIIRAGQIAWESLALRAGWIDEPTKITYNGNMTTWGKIYNILRGVSQVSGLPLGNAMRDLNAMWNSTVGEITGKKIQTYDPGPEKQIQYAVKDGYLTEEEAVKLLLEKEIAENEIEARQMAYVWANPEKYENMLAAMRAGDKEGFEAAKDQLEDLRYKQSSIMAAVTSEVKEMYLGTDGTEPISREEAMNLMMEYGGMIERKAETEIQKWTCELETGIPYDGIDEAYIAGDITREQAEKMLVEYGGYAEDKAAAQVQKWTSQVDEGIWYSEIDDYYFYGDITYKEAVDMYMKYGGKSREDAENAVLETKFLKDFGRERNRAELQDMYVSGEYDRDKMKEIMLEYGYSANENSAENSLIRWDFIGDDMSLDEVTPTQAKAYFNGLEAAEIDKHTFLDFANQVGELKADYDANGKAIAYSKMDKVLSLIDSLDLSDEQKDALALIYGADGKGYAEKNLSRAPWHNGDTTSKTKKKPGGRRGGGGGGRRRGGGGRGGRRSSGGLSLPAVEAVDNSGGHSSEYNDLLDKWRKRKLTRAEILKLLKEGKLTQEEADEILGTMQEGGEGADSELLSGGLQLGAAEDAALLKEP